MKWTLIETMPSTNVRMAVSFLCVLATATRVVISKDWSPPYEWLAFLTLMMGLDVAQFIAKRKTQVSPPPGDEGSEGGKP